jgi:beta-galactosidase
MKHFYLLFFLLLTGAFAQAQTVRKTESFNAGWKFMLGDEPQAKNEVFNDTKWRSLNLPHDWSIEGPFDEKNTAGQNEGGLPAGIGWYRKTFTIPATAKGKRLFVDFDGVYRNSEVWLNGHLLGKRPNGYISFEYELTNHLKFGQPNIIAVRVDNSQQPNSRWYSGSGIYRNVWLVTKSSISIDHWGIQITTPSITAKQANVEFKITIKNSAFDPLKSVLTKKRFLIKASVYDSNSKKISTASQEIKMSDGMAQWQLSQQVTVLAPMLWSVTHPYLYKGVVQLYEVSATGDKSVLIDDYTTNVGIRSFNFDADKGFSLNGQRMKINGVCMHHDLGALGAAVNTRAMERQLEILKAMGCNAIRTSHNPPAPELLDLCDRMGFLVMDEAFDMWKKKKNKFDYSWDWDKWHVQDLQDQVLRDRNHPSVFVWSIGNEIREQKDSTGINIGRELVAIVKQLDKTRPVTSALSDADLNKNFIYQSNALDLVGLNYHPEVYAGFQKNYPGQKFIGTEQMSALASRGFYDQPTDTTRLWPQSSKEKYTKGNPEMAVTAYDNVAAYWGSTHEDTWKIIKKHDFLSGMFVWTGFDYLGEPTPYPWPARSSYFGIVDLAGFSKDVYYMYQSEWTNKPVLHLLPHWNWETGKTIDVWAYYNNADEVELYLNGKSLGIRKKAGDDLHVMWRVKYEPGTLKAVSRKNGKTVLTTQKVTAGAPYQIKLTADRSKIKAEAQDLSFITVSVLDKQGNPVPVADNLIKFKVSGAGTLKAVDNGSQTSLEPFSAQQCKLFSGLCLGIIQSKPNAGKVTISASAEGLLPAQIVVQSQK